MSDNKKSSASLSDDESAEFELITDELHNECRERQQAKEQEVSQELEHEKEREPQRGLEQGKEINLEQEYEEELRQEREERGMRPEQNQEQDRDQDQEQEQEQERSVPSASSKTKDKLVSQGYDREPCFVTIRCVVERTKTSLPSDDRHQCNKIARSVPCYDPYDGADNDDAYKKEAYNDGDVVVEKDEDVTFVGSTLFHDIVRSALDSLGYSEESLRGTRGSIELKNWKSMSFEAITENKRATLVEVLKLVCSHTTLRIRLSNYPSRCIIDDVKQKLLSYLLERSQDLLADTGCPLKKIPMSPTSDEDFQRSLTDDLFAEFNCWYDNQMNNCHRQQQQLVQQREPLQQQHLQHQLQQRQQQQQQQQLLPQHFSTNEQSPLIASSSRSKNGQIRPSHQIRTLQNLAALPSDSASNYSPSKCSTPSSETKRPTPTCGGVRGGGGGSRTWFDPDTELPWLQAWLASNRHPTRAEMIRYVEELNSREYRRVHRPLDLSNLSYWFKNARARSSTGRKPRQQQQQQQQLQLQQRGPAVVTNGPASNKHLVRAPQSDDHTRNGDSSASQPPAEKRCRMIDVNNDDDDDDDDCSVPVLPNSNAVYVINPLLQRSTSGGATDVKPDGERVDLVYSSSGESSSSSSSEDEGEDGGKWSQGKNGKISDVNGNGSGIERGTMEVSDSPQDEATDLRVRSDRNGVDTHPSSTGLDHHGPRRAFHKDSDHSDRSGENRSILSETTKPTDWRIWHARDSDDYLSDRSDKSDSPQYQKMELPNRGQFPPHPLFPFSAQMQRGSLHHQQQAMLQIAAMSHALRFMRPAAVTVPSPSPYGMASAVASRFYAGPTRPGSSSPPNLYDDEYRDDSRGGGALSPSANGSANGDVCGDSQRKRSRVFIDPLSEIPKLEQWFLLDSHPSSFVIEQFTEELNRASYRQRFPRLEPKNVQLWFKNHRAKVKRQRVGDSPISSLPEGGVGGDGGSSGGGSAENRFSSMERSRDGLRNGLASPVGIQVRM